MKRTCLIIIAGLLFSSVLAFGQEVYKWVDEKGTVHFTDDLGEVPEKYQEQIQKKMPPKETIPSQPTSPPSIESPKSMEPEKEAESAPGSVQKDILGRGEEWWRAKVNEWNEKLKTSQRNYENAYSEWKSKENELETSKFKPDSLKRKLKAEIKTLEEKTRDWEKQMEEAKNMLENVLPKQAQDYQANPEWLNIEEKK
jgi:hypothetical protein